MESTGARSSLLTVVDRRAKNTENTESQEKVPTLAQTNAEKLAEPLQRNENTMVSSIRKGWDGSHRTSMLSFV